MNCIRINRVCSPVRVVFETVGLIVKKWNEVSQADTVNFPVIAQKYYFVCLFVCCVQARGPLCLILVPARSQ